VVVEIDNKNGDFGGFVTWPFKQFGNSGVDQEYSLFAGQDHGSCWAASWRSASSNLSIALLQDREDLDRPGSGTQEARREIDTCFARARRSPGAVPSMAVKAVESYEAYHTPRDIPSLMQDAETTERIRDFLGEKGATASSMLLLNVKKLFKRLPRALTVSYPTTRSVHRTSQRSCTIALYWLLGLYSTRLTLLLS